jgi:hypothetical protein
MSSIEQLYRKALKAVAKETRAKSGGKRIDFMERRWTKSKAVERAVSGRTWAGKGTYDKKILGAMAKAAWVDHWANREEEKGRSFSGQDLWEVAPSRIPSQAKKWAKEVAMRLLLDEKQANLTALYLHAVSTFSYTGDPEKFGYHLGMQAMGHGVSWQDDAKGAHSSDIHPPYMEFYM